MKRCPECRRDYYDDSLLYCLDDGSALLEGPASGSGGDEPATAILQEGATLVKAEPRAPAHSGQSEPGSTFPPGSEKPGFFAHRAAKPLAAGLVAVILLVGGFFSYRYLSTAGSKQIESIAVMPFVNGSGNPDLEYLSDGMTETLISSLSQLPSLNVKARSSVFRYKGTDAEPKSLGSELSVQAILNGRIVQRGQDLFLNVELIDARTENVLWTQNYQRRTADLLTLQGEIARDVSEKLVIKLSGAERLQIAKEYTADTEAYNLYLRGRYHLNKRTLKDVQRAIDYFQQAVGKDPNYALAFTGLADAYAVLPSYSGQLPDETAPRAREAALRALSLDGNLSEAHASLALIMNGHDYDFAGAEREFKRAIELDPKNATAIVNYGNLLIQLGKFDEGLELMRRGLELEPLSLPMHRLYGFGLYHARRYKESEEHLRKTIDLDPTFVLAYYTISSVYIIQNKYPEAVDSYARGLEAAGARESAEETRKSFANGGWEGFERFRLQGAPRNRPRVLVAGSYLRLNEKDKALAELEQARTNREAFVTMVKVDPGLDPLRDDPRFEELLKRIGFPN